MAGGRYCCEAPTIDGGEGKRIASGGGGAGGEGGLARRIRGQRGEKKSSGGAKERGGKMAKLALIYGMRLLPEEELGELKDATVVLKNGKTARVTMHLIEGSKEEIEATFHESVAAFFELYPEI
ncbi:MAG TPA: hypothetical protein VJN93_17200 [Candidatus Acidoferrum sp.]|nr:hypothetical protein [Candidatus Acidoferrum sp.]